MDQNVAPKFIESLWDIEWSYIGKAWHCPTEDRHLILRALKLHRDRLDTWIEMNEKAAEEEF